MVTKSMRLLTFLFATSWLVSLPGKTTFAETKSIRVPATRPFTDTGISLEEGEAVRIDSTGLIEITPWSYWGRDGYDWQVGPLGTYDFKNSVQHERFPLPAAQRGPAPGYCLSGKIGADGEPFFVGERYYDLSPKDGKLYLGINDFDCSDNAGEFIAEVKNGEDAKPPEEAADDIVFSSKELPKGEPVPGARVVLIYVDGLRYDVLREMAEDGHLPVIKKHFFDGGTDFVNAFVAFPSSTLVSNATIYTGLFPNRSGIKGNSYFDRKKQKGYTYLDPFSPTAAADAIRPSGLHHLGVIIKRGILRLFPSAYKRYALKRKHDVPLLEDYIEGKGKEYYTTVQPIHPENPPNRYELDACNVIPPFYYHHAKDYVDRINSRYGHDLVIQPDAYVMNFWFPDVDSFGESNARSQFGQTRKSIFLLDRRVDRIIAELKRKKLWDQTYLIIFSDHGMLGGKSVILQDIDFGREFFYRPAVDEDTDGKLDADSGMGCNVRWYDDSYRRKGRTKKGFVFVYNAGGAGRIYLPYREVDSGNWLRRNNLYDLTHYCVAPGYGEVNLVERLLAWNVGDNNLFPEQVSSHPVDQVLVKVDDNRVAVFGQNGRGAIIERKKDRDNNFLFRYIPAVEISCSPEGKISYHETSSFDPFDYLEAGIKPDWFTTFHTEREWLERTKYLSYPDAVVAVANQMFWDGKMALRERRESPDMIICANRGWAFKEPDKAGGSHGYLHADSIRMPFLVTGPNARKGLIVDDPVRSADIVPTVLTLVGIPFNQEAFDGRPVKAFLEEPGEAEPPASGRSARAILANLPYSDEETDKSDLLLEYERRKADKKPVFLMPDTRYKGHDFERATDIHVIGADLLSIFNWEVFTVLDQIFDFAYPGDKKRPFNTAFDKMIAMYDKLPDRYPKERVRELVFALQIREASAGEVPSVVLMSIGGLTGRGVFFRVILLLRFMEHMFSDMDHAILYPVRDKNIKLVSNINYLFGGLRIGLEKLSWGLTHYIGRAVWDGVRYIEKGNEKIVRAVKHQQPPT